MSYIQTSGSATPDRQLEIRRFMIENLWSRNISIKSLAEKFRISRSVITKIARDLVPTFAGPVFRDKVGEWGKQVVLSERYGLTQTEILKILGRAKASGRPVRRRLVLTYSQPLNGEYFYHLGDVERAAPRYKRRKRVLAWLKGIRGYEPTGHGMEEDLLLIVLFIYVYHRQKHPSIRALSVATGVKDRETIRSWLKRLQAADCIRLSHPLRNRPPHYEFGLNYPHGLWDILLGYSKLKPPFEEADK